MPAADHGQSKSQLDLALEQPTVSEALQDELGAHVSTSKVERARVLVHMQNLCRHPHPNSDKLTVSKMVGFQRAPRGMLGVAAGAKFGVSRVCAQ